MVAEAQRAPRVVRDQMTAFSTHPALGAPQPTTVRRMVDAVEPWYNWGKISVERMQELRLSDGGRIESGGEGDVRFFTLQWLEVHIELQIGRTPKAVR